jgi:hypothetical protein
VHDAGAAGLIAGLRAVGAVDGYGAEAVG